MARTPSKHYSLHRSKKPTTLAESLFYLPDPGNRQALEQYRIEYEAVHGPTDLTKRYTSTWPQEQQDWMMTHELKRYFDGLPPFVKAFVKSKMQSAASEGRLDDMPDDVLSLFISGNMCLDCEESPQR